MADADVRLSALDSKTNLATGDLLLSSVVDPLSPTGYTSKKTTAGNLADTIVNEYTFADLDTDAKTIIGAINEAAQSGGSGAGVFLVTRTYGVFDKTAAEIVAAYEAGAVVFLRDQLFYLMTFAYQSGTTTTMYFSSYHSTQWSQMILSCDTNTDTISVSSTPGTNLFHGKDVIKTCHVGDTGATFSFSNGLTLDCTVQFFKQDPNDAAGFRNYFRAADDLIDTISYSGGTVTVTFKEPLTEDWKIKARACI